jgi:hypothetical protein
MEKMAKKPKNKLKEILLIAFVIISIVLVVFQWADGIWRDDGDITPSFVRPTFQNFEVGEDAYENWNQLELTPTHQYQKTDTPGITPTADQ